MRTWIRSPLAILADEAAAGGVVGRRGARRRVACPPARRRTRPAIRVFDASRHVVLPGLVNAHHHFYQTLTRAHGPALGKELFDWLKTLYPVWAGLTPDQLDTATRLALAELVALGLHHRRGPPLRVSAGAGGGDRRPGRGGPATSGYG